MLGTITMDAKIVDGIVAIQEYTDAIKHGFIVLDTFAVSKRASEK
jgi:hypothetical protein